MPAWEAAAGRRPCSTGRRASRHHTKTTWTARGNKMSRHTASAQPSKVQGTLFNSTQPMPSPSPAQGIT
jgi:hypothetical protein